MGKVLPAEDETASRRGLKEKVNWQKFGMQIIEEADDGLEGSRMAWQKRPDLAILDVRRSHPRHESAVCYCVYQRIGRNVTTGYLDVILSLCCLQSVCKPNIYYM